MEIDYQKVVYDLIYPLVFNKDDLVVRITEDTDAFINITILVNETDMGKVIGRSGKVINAVRTLTYAASKTEGKKIDIEVEHI